LLVGPVASVVGVGIGVLLAIGLKGLFDAFGATIPEGPLTVLPRTVIVAMAVGLVVTLASALIPARRAAKVPPVAALREAEQGDPRSLARRALTGSVVTGLGLLLLLVGLFTGVDPAIAYVGFGAAILFVGVSILAPLFARALARGIGAPLPRVYGVTGTLARENSIRRPRRTAATASALMVGVALVGFVAILTSSIKGSVATSITENFGAADYQIEAAGFGDPSDPTFGVSPALADRLRARPELAVVSQLRFGAWRRPGKASERFLVGVDPDTIDRVYNLDLQEGDLGALAEGGVLVSKNFAEDNELTVGSPLPMEFPLTGVGELEVVGIFAGEGLGDQFIALDTYQPRYSRRLDSMVLVKAADGVSPADSRAAVDRVAADFPNAEVSDHAEFIAKQESQINIILSIFTALLGLAILIAFLGIANTLALSIFERTREIGLLRAVGMSRRQVRRMIRWEAVIIALFGAVLGVLIGSFLGWAVTAALADEGLSELSFPFGLLGIYVLVGAIGGILASIVPAYRGSRIKLLEAIAYE
ncbi:MAG: ABC transporter permease, partial [Acidimicrobiia bacterium]